MKLKQLVLSIGISAVAAGGLARADETSDAITALRQQIEQLDQKIRVLERKQELDQEASVEAAKTAPKVSVGSSGLNIGSADTNFTFGIHGLLQVDNRTFINDHGINGNDSFLLRRARPIFSGTLYRDFDFLFVPDFGTSSSPQTANPTPTIQDAYLNYRARPWLQFRAGKFKVPVGLEFLQSDPVTAFGERSIATDLVPARDIGFQLWGDIGGGVLSYAVGVFGGAGDGRTTFNADFEDHREFAARLFVQPFKNSDVAALKGAGFGIGGSWGSISSNSVGLPGGFLTDGQQQFFTYTNGTVADGEHWRVSPQGYYYYGPFSLLGEYAISHQRVRRGGLGADLQNTAWQVTAGWILTGEEANFAGFAPKRPFNPRDGQWGAFQLVARYGELDVDDAAFPNFANPAASASAAHAWGVGLNWFLNKNLRVNTSYSHTAFTGGGKATGSAATSAPGIVTRQDEEVFLSRLQLSF